MYRGFAMSAGRQVRKSWQFGLAQAHALHNTLCSILEPVGTGALVLPDGTALAVKPSAPEDIATLPQAASLCHQYLKLNDLDIALTNDPQSGGTTLSDFTLVAGACFESAGPAAEVLLVKRISFPGRSAASGKLDDEGVRVPPMPIAAGGQVSTDLLAAMAAHPLAPQGLAAAINLGCMELFGLIRKIKAMGADPGSEFRKANFKRYLADCAQVFEDKIHGLPLGAKQITQRLASGETIKLQIRVDEAKISFDFAGSDASKTIGLTDMMTFGACMAVISAMFDNFLPLNSGTFGLIQVSAPSRTLLSGQGPVGTFHSTRMGVPAICEVVRSAFAVIDPSLKAAQNASTTGHVQFEFDDGRFWSCAVQPGLGATATAPGLDAHALWAPRSSLAQATSVQSMEKLETDYPLRALTAGIRPGSGGKGQHRGGNGALLSFEALAPLHLQWDLGTQALRQEGHSGGRASSPAQIDIVRAKDSSRETREEPSGRVRIEAGDQIHILGAGGGAFGAPAESEKPGELG
jgi:N-methylhydantoinase B